MTNRLNWKQYFMLQALMISARSTCNRLSVGAVLVQHKSIIASGYNGSVAGNVHCNDVGCKVIDGHCVRTIHAEVNAITQCAKNGIATNQSEIYITDFPCLNCTKMLIQAGIKQINYLNNYHNDDYVNTLLKRNNIEINQVKIDTKTLGEQISLIADKIDSANNN